MPSVELHVLSLLQILFDGALHFAIIYYNYDRLG